MQHQRIQSELRKTPALHSPEDIRILYLYKKRICRNVTFSVFSVYIIFSDLSFLIFYLGGGRLLSSARVAFLTFQQTPDFLLHEAYYSIFISTFLFKVTDLYLICTEIKSFKNGKNDAGIRR